MLSCKQVASHEYQQVVRRLSAIRTHDTLYSHHHTNMLIFLLNFIRPPRYSYMDLFLSYLDDILI